MGDLETENAALRAMVVRLKKKQDLLGHEPNMLVEGLFNVHVKLDAALAALKTAHDAFEAIRTMGRVCPEFELCDHVACADSCGAYLKATEALEAIRPALEAK